MNKIVRFLLKLFTALILGLIITGFVVQRDEQMLAAIEQKIHTNFGTSFDCVSSGKVVGLNLLWPTIEIESMVVKSSQEPSTWHWSCRRAVIQFPWLSVLFHRAIPLHITLHDVRSQSAVHNGKPDIAVHLQKLSTPVPGGLPIFGKELVMRNIVTQLQDTERDISVVLQGHSMMRKINGRSRWNIYPVDGQLAWQDKPYITKIAGSVLLDIEGADLYVDSSLQCSLPCLHKTAEQGRRCFVRGAWENGKGNLNIHTADRAMVIGPITVADYQCAGQVSIRIDHLQQLAPSISSFHLSGGVCQLQVNGDIRNLLGTVRADVTVRDCIWAGMRLPAAQFTLSADDRPTGPWSGILDLQLAQGFELTGSWSWDNTVGVSLAASNHTPIALPMVYWYIKPEAMQLLATVDRNGGLRGQYNAVVTHEKLGTQHTGSGTIVRDDKAMTIRGTIGDNPMVVVCGNEPFALTSAQLRSKSGQQLLALRATGPQQLRATVDYALIRSMLPQKLQEDFVGQGTVVMAVEPQGNIITGSLYLQDGTVKIPQLYNYLNELRTSFTLNMSQRSLSCTDAQIGFHRGKLRVPRATGFFDERYRIEYVYMPILVDDLFASWQGDLFAAISGSALLQKQKNQAPSLRGTFFADKAQLRTVAMSQQSPRQLLPLTKSSLPVVDLDLHLLSRDSLHINTPLLDARVTADLAVRRTTAEPEVTGKVKFLSGQLKFPYKPLNIVSGLLTLPGNTEDPVIELFAKNKIRKYNVSLQVNGTLSNPQIVVDSSPVLTQEQIMALLLAGAEEGSLSLLMPTLVVQNLQQVLFDTQQKKAPLNNYFKTLLKPLSRVRLVPSFIDETGRGGLRGAIEIEVSDELSAVIEKNFSLPEDTKIKIDYAISDDVSIRGIRDERGDLGSEVEFRWHR
jgi:hypothetical protein